MRSTVWSGVLRRLGLFERLALAAWLTLAAAAAALSTPWFSWGALESFQLCLFRRLTGTPCPGCGMGHALLYAFQGRLEQSFHHHPLGLPFLALWTGWLLWGLANLRRGRRFSEGFPLRWGKANAWAALAVVLGVYFLRMF